MKLEVLVEVPNRQPRQLGWGGDEHIGDGLRSVPRSLPLDEEPARCV